MSIGQRSRFTRGRAIALSYVTFVSFLVFLVCVFVLPSAATKVPLLALVSGISFVTGCLAFLSLLGSKLCKRRTIQVGLEAIWTVCLVPIEVLNIAACFAVGRGNSPPQQTGDSSSSPDGSTPMSAASARSFSALLTIVTGSATLVLFFYAVLVLTLSLYTSRKRTGSRTRIGDIWFEAIDGPTCPFLIYPALHFILQSNGIEGTPVPPFTAALPGHPSLNEFSRNGNSSAHHCPPGCSCAEKPPPRPSKPEDYREIQRMRLEAKKNAVANSNTDQPNGWSFMSFLGRLKRDTSTPILPAVRIPTDRDRRRSVFTVAFEVV